jgi:hypothetical protein
VCVPFISQDTYRPWPGANIAIFEVQKVFGPKKEIAWGGIGPSAILLGYNSHLENIAAHETGHSLSLSLPDHRNHQGDGPKVKSWPLMDEKQSPQGCELDLEEVLKARAFLSSHLGKSLTLSAPAKGASFVLGETINLSATAVGLGPKDRVEFHAINRLTNIDSAVAISGKSLANGVFTAKWDLKSSATNPASPAQWLIYATVADDLFSDGNIIEITAAKP